MVSFCNGNMHHHVTVLSGTIKDFISVTMKFFVLEYNVLFMVVILWE